jgi:2-polyprenyl-3-methyl-5-hydroxy-6-metoxy-1,4-benzoquinol methylase
MHHVPACPACHHTDYSPFLSCKDYTVSHETFQLVKCTNCGFVITSPRPEEDELPRYYQSQAYISHANRSLNLVDAVYKVTRRFTLQWKYNIMQKHSIRKPSSLFDFGCGTGDFLLECKKHGMNISGAEPSIRARNEAARKTGANIAPALNQIAGKFDAITLWHVLEHVPDLEATLVALKHHLEKEGTLFIAIPNYRSKDATRYGVHWAGFDVPRHLWHFSKDTMARLLTRVKLNVVHILPMPLDAYYVSLLSEKYKTGNYNVSTITKGLLQGWKSNRAAKSTREYSSLIYIIRK